MTLKEVRAPAALESAQPVLLNCLIVGDKSDKAFVVEISKNKSVSILKKLIKEENPSSLANIDTKDIDLWHVSSAINKLGSKGLSTRSPKLKSERPLSEVLRSKLDPRCIHIAVRVPTQGEHGIDSGLVFLIIPSRRSPS